jgi:hypothetical protein
MKSTFACALSLVLLPFSSCKSAEPEWVPLFNGKDLTGWTPKIAGSAAGENPYNTFRVEDGILKACYDQYPKFDEKFGHLYTDVSYSHYILRMEYRFDGQKMADAPGYVNFNSGVMVHSQGAKDLGKDQSFPISLEFQFLADEGNGKRSTGNVCTPGTHIEIDGKLVTQHIVESSAPTFAPEEWVKMEIEVRGHDEIIHRINGKEVLRYQKPQLDPTCRICPAQPLIDAGASKDLSSGHIALQAEGHPVWFRNIEIKKLPVGEKK